MEYKVEVKTIEGISEDDNYTRQLKCHVKGDLRFNLELDEGSYVYFLDGLIIH